MDLVERLLQELVTPIFFPAEAVGRLEHLLSTPQPTEAKESLHQIDKIATLTLDAGEELYLLMLGKASGASSSFGLNQSLPFTVMARRNSEHFLKLPREVTAVVKAHFVRNRCHSFITPPQQRARSG